MVSNSLSITIGGNDILRKFTWRHFVKTVIKKRTLKTELISLQLEIYLVFTNNWFLINQIVILTFVQCKTYLALNVYNNLYMYKVVISVCLFECPIKPEEPLGRFASIFNWETWENRCLLGSLS